MTPKTTELNSRVGRVLRRHRIVRGKSQADLGADVGITFQQIGKYEKGIDTLTLPKCIMLAHALKIRPENFIIEALGKSKEWQPSDRLILELVKRFVALGKREQNAVIALTKSLKTMRVS